jgi:hypothetical protein
VTAYHSTAFGAAPLRCFPFQKGRHTVLFYELEVLYLTQMVFGPIALVEGLQPAAGIIITFVAEPHEAFPQPLALLPHKGAVLAARQATGTVADAKSFLSQVVCPRQVGGTNSAVHAAGSDQFLIHGFHPSSIQSTKRLAQIRLQHVCASSGEIGLRMGQEWATFLRGLASSHAEPVRILCLERRRNQTPS